MGPSTPIYGYSRGYRLLAVLALAAVGVSLVALDPAGGTNAVATSGVVGFTILFAYAWRRSTRRVEVLHIEERGFAVVDPAQYFGIIAFEEIGEVRIYAVMERPMVAFHLLEPIAVRRRGPAMLRGMLKPLWAMRHYHIVVQLDAWDDQIMAVKSTAVMAGIPVRSELI